jgi:hypothetical protein
MTLLMFDSDQPDKIPSGVFAAGYVDGYAASAWASPVGFPRFPGARRIAVFFSTTVTDGDSFDVENGDMTPAEAPAAVHNAHARGIAVPWVYCNRANRPAVENALVMAGVMSDQVALWIATLDGTQTVPAGPYPIAAVQYANSAMSGGHYDISIVNEVFGPGGGSIQADAAPRRQTIVAMQDGDIVVARRGTDSALWYLRYDAKAGTWSNWLSLGGSLSTQDICYVVRGNQIDLFVTGDGPTRPDGTASTPMFHIWSADSGVTWSQFEPHGGDGSAMVAIGGTFPTPPSPPTPPTPLPEPTTITLEIPAQTVTGKLS